MPSTREFVNPMRELAASARKIGHGDFSQRATPSSVHEIAVVAQAFNTMAHHLREYRQSQSAQLLRAQQTIQATIDSFPDPVLVIDTDGAVEMANPAARRLMGVVPKQKGQAASGIWHPPDPLRQPLGEALQELGV